MDHCINSLFMTKNIIEHLVVFYITTRTTTAPTIWKQQLDLFFAVHTRMLKYIANFFPQVHYRK